MSSKREGACTLCGRCCMSVSLALSTDFDVPDNDQRVEDYCRWLDYHNVQYTRNAKHIELIIGGRCKHLGFVDRKSQCMIYDKRPIVCKEFPVNPSLICSGFTFKEETDNDKKGERVTESNAHEPLPEKKGGDTDGKDKVSEVRDDKLPS